MLICSDLNLDLYLLSYDVASMPIDPRGCPLYIKGIGICAGQYRATRGQNAKL